MARADFRIMALGLLCGGLIGCATVGDDHAQAMRTAAQDDQYCMLAGFRYPDAAYVSCRYKLDDTRFYKEWRSVGMMQQSAQPAAAISPPPVVTPRFVPLDAGRYRCWPDPEFGSNYIVCGTDDRQR